MAAPGRRLLTVAHRAGNTRAGLRAALDAGVDLVEADVHAHRGRLEVRHLKSAGGLPWLWDRGELVRRSGYDVLELAEVVVALDGAPRLMVDLKGVHPQVAPMVARVLREVAPACALTVCTRHWWMLDAFDLPVRQVLSAGSRGQLLRLRRRLADRPAYGACVRIGLLTPGLVARLRERTEVVLTWPVDTPLALAAARRLGVDAVIGKDLDVLRAAAAQGRPQAS